MTAQIGHLDYPKLDIRMYWSSDREQSYRLHACAKEPWTVAWIEQMPPNSVLYDVGACVGSYALLAAALGQTVVAIEPSFANYARLCENIILNDLGHKIVPVCMALSSIGGDCQVMEQELQPGYSGGSKRLRVPVLPLLDLHLMFGLPRPTHIKLDTDGHEAQVIEGVQGLLPDVSWMVEIQTGQEPRINALLGTPAAVFNERNGKPIVGMHMAIYEPARVPAHAGL